MKTVVAIKQGFHNGSLIEPGTSFEVGDNQKGKWFVDAESYKSKTPEPVAEDPSSLSELQRKKPVSHVDHLQKKPRQPKPIEAMVEDSPANQEVI